MIRRAVDSAAPAENASRFLQPLGIPFGYPTDSTAPTTTGYSWCPSKRGRSIRVLCAFAVSMCVSVWIDPQGASADWVTNTLRWGLLTVNCRLSTPSQRQSGNPFPPIPPVALRNLLVSPLIMFLISRFVLPLGVGIWAAASAPCPPPNPRRPPRLRAIRPALPSRSLVRRLR